jgi:hypothetical protein
MEVISLVQSFKWVLFLFVNNITHVKMLNICYTGPVNYIVMFRIDLLYYFFSNLRKHNIRLYKIKYEVSMKINGF